MISWEIHCERKVSEVACCSKINQCAKASTVTHAKRTEMTSIICQNGNAATLKIDHIFDLIVDDQQIKLPLAHFTPSQLVDLLLRYACRQKATIKHAGQTLRSFSESIRKSPRSFVLGCVSESDATLRAIQISQNFESSPCEIGMPVRRGDVWIVHSLFATEKGEYLWVHYAGEENGLCSEVRFSSVTVADLEEKIRVDSWRFVEQCLAGYKLALEKLVKKCMVNLLSAETALRAHERMERCLLE